MFLRSATLLALLPASFAADVSLRDHPLATFAAPTYLDGGAWTASMEAPPGLPHGAAPPLLQINASVPGDLLTDLQRAGVIADPWLDTTWIKNSSLWAEHVWTYSTNFSVGDASLLTGADGAAAAMAATTLLTFDGVKMGATVRVNGRVVGVLRDQFLRYSFPLDATALGLKGDDEAGQASNRLSVTFGLGDVPEEGRFMACTGGWDWAPFSYTSTVCTSANQHGCNTLSKGLWKSVYVSEVAAGAVAITHVTPHTTYAGAYPTAPLADGAGAHGGFRVNVTAHLWAPPGGATGVLSVAGSWEGGGGGHGGGGNRSAPLTLPAGDSRVSLQLAATAAQVKLWWPAGVGEQPLYNVSAIWTPASSTAAAATTATGSSAATTATGSSAAAAAAAAATTTTTAVRRLGFRVFALVSINDTDPAAVAAAAVAVSNVTGTHGMFFRVNGAAIYSRGANMIPMEELEGRLDGEAHRILVQSAADAGMNTLRVWGGGIFYPTSFYDACDEHGLLVYHDMQYASTGGGSHGPIATPTQDAELRHQIRRLSHHPAIVLWDGANEVITYEYLLTSAFLLLLLAYSRLTPQLVSTPKSSTEQVTVQPNSSAYVFATFVMTVVAQEDQTRVVWPASPAAGWVTGVSMLYQTPNLHEPGGMNLTTKHGGHIWNMGIETHAPYQLGSGWPTVNGGVKDECFVNPDTGSGVTLPNVFKRGPAGSGSGGVAQRNIYASEFGTGGSSSFESMSGALSPQHWGLHGGMAADECSAPDMCIGEHNCTGRNPMTQRNYGCDGQIRMYWGNRTAVDLDATGAAAFKGQLYQCQLTQAIVLKQVYEARRAQNQLGHLIWMLNEIWPTVGWGSLEYGPAPGPLVTPGQVRGGRWKPVHYFYKRSLMTDVMATCGALYREPAQQRCYLSNHRASRPFRGTVTLTAYDHFGDGSGVVLMAQEMALPQGPGAIAWFSPPAPLPPGNTTSVVSTVTDEAGAVVSEHVVQLATPEFIRAPAAAVTLAIADAPRADGSIDIAVTSDRVALWVTLTTLAQGRFSDNAFLLPATTKTVRFVPFSASTAAQDLAALKASLRVEDFSMYRSLPPAAPTPAPPTPAPTACDPASFLQGMDYHDGQGLGHAPAADAAHCCALCASAAWAAKGCTHFTFAADGTCWLKPDGSNKRPSAGSVCGAVLGPGGSSSE